MSDIDKILKQFGGDATQISINYIDGKWCMSYGGQHLECDENISVCADKMLVWYNDKHTYKRAAEELWRFLDLLSCDENPKIVKICEARNYYIKKDENGNLIWNPAYHDSNPSSLNISDNVKTTKQKSNVVKPIDEPVKKEFKRDDYPDYFIVQKDDIYTTTECWGYDVNGERTRVIVNRISPKSSIIESTKPEFSENTQTLEINESEYNDYYDEACRLISTNL